MNGERYGQKSNTHSSRGETKDAGTLVAPKFFGRKYKKTTSPACMCARAQTPLYKIWGYNICPVCPTLLSEGWNWMAFCRSLLEGKKKKRIARTNTWTSLEKGGNNIKGKYDVLVYVCTVYQSIQRGNRENKTMRIRIDVCIFIPLAESCSLIWCGDFFKHKLKRGNWRSRRVWFEWKAIIVKRQSGTRRRRRRGP
jgi:hypothetical protein